MTVALVAQFDRTDEARDAMVALETTGIDADAINIVNRPLSMPTKDATRGVELDAGRYVAGGYTKGGIIGAVIGAVVLMFAVGIVQADPLGTWLLAALVAGAVGGALVGGFFGVEKRLPVNPDAFDTFGIDPSAEAGVAVEVRVEEARADAAAKVLGEHHPRNIERRAA